jgi:hypothetical protein
MPYTTGTTMYNPYVVNIIDLQAGEQSASGISLTETVNQMSQMLDFPTKTLSIDNINTFSGNAINVNSEIQFNNDATFLGPINVEATGGGATFSNADGSAYQMSVYGTLIASNLVLLSSSGTSGTPGVINVDYINNFSDTMPINVTSDIQFNKSIIGDMNVYGNVAASSLFADNMTISSLNVISTFTACKNVFFSDNVMNSTYNAIFSTNNANSYNMNVCGTITLDTLSTVSPNGLYINAPIVANGGAIFSNADTSACKMNVYGQIATSNISSLDSTGLQINSPLIVNSSTFINGSMYVSPTAPGEAIMGALGVSSFILKVYGDVYSSNLTSLCPMKFNVHDLSGILFEAMRITELGNVGIGTFAPSERLVVDGTIKNTGNVVVGGSMDITGDVVIRGNLRVLGTITNS